MFNHRQNFLEFYKPLSFIMMLLHKKFDENKIKIKNIFNFVGVTVLSKEGLFSLFSFTRNSKNLKVN